MDTAVDKALIVVGSLVVATGGRPPAETAATTGLPKATTHRLLATLLRHGYVQQLANGDYALGMQIIALGAFAASTNDLASLGRPILDRLVLECGETVHLGVLQGDALLYIDRREPEDTAVRLATLPSPLTSLHASASGKVLLAFGPDSLREEVLGRPLARYTDGTIAEPDALDAELAQIRENGYAINREERYAGVIAVGVPVRNLGGRVVAALSAAGPIQRMDETKVEDVRILLTQAAAELSRGLR